MAFRIKFYSSKINGSFSRVLEPGDYTISISADGYKTAVEHVNYSDSENNLGIVSLERE